MDRLTRRRRNGLVLIAEGRVQEACERLAAYEDTGLEPERIEELIELFTDDQVVELARILRKAFECGEVDRIRDLIQTEQDGRLVVLPCKVGDTVYVIGESCDFCETYLDEPERCMRCEKGHYVEERGFELWMLSELNESIFLTREEAEAALAGKESAAPDAPEEPAEPEWKDRVMRTFLGGR